MGHKFSGVIEEVREGVMHISPGKQSVVQPTIFDRQCISCKMGNKNWPLGRK